ncbi:MAG: hypothetical protein AAF391_08210 [Bacteroidota bacterium]
MGHYKMNFSGSLKLQGRRYRFNEGDVIELPDSAKLSEEQGKKVSKPKDEKKKEKIEGKEMETAAKEPKSEKRTTK